jgi:hypothetical protein
MLTVEKAGSSFSTQRIQHFSLNVESIGEKSESYSGYNISHNEYKISIGGIQYPERTDSDFNHKYGPNEILTFTVNTFSGIEKPVRVNITRLDIEKSTDCAYDSLTFITPSTEMKMLTISGRASTDYR